MNKNAYQHNFEDDDDDYSDYEDDFESDEEEESTAMESTGATPNLKPPSMHQQQELDRVVQTYAEFLESTAGAEVVSGFSQYEFSNNFNQTPTRNVQHAQTEVPKGLSHSESQPIKPMNMRMEEQKAQIEKMMGPEIYSKVLQILMLHKARESDG